MAIRPFCPRGLQVFHAASEEVAQHDCARPRSAQGEIDQALKTRIIEPGHAYGLEPQRTVKARGKKGARE